MISPIIKSSIHSFHFLKTPNLVNKYNARTVQKITSRPMLFIFQSSYEYQPPSSATYIVWLFCQFLTFHFCGSKGFSYGKKNFESDNIQRSILVRCRLGKLAFFIQGRIARYARLQKPPNHCSALGSRSFITAQIDLAICPSLLLKLSISFVYLTAHRGVNYLVYINNYIP